MGAEKLAQLPEPCLGYHLGLFCTTLVVKLQNTATELLLFIAQVPIVSGWASFLEKSFCNTGERTNRGVQKGRPLTSIECSKFSSSTEEIICNFESERSECIQTHTMIIMVVLEVSLACLVG